LRVKINYIIKSNKSLLQVESILETESILLESNQTCDNQFYTYRINYGHSRSGTK